MSNLPQIDRLLSLTPSQSPTPKPPSIEDKVWDPIPFVGQPSDEPVPLSPSTVETITPRLRSAGPSIADVVAEQIFERDHRDELTSARISLINAALVDPDKEARDQKVADLTGWSIEEVKNDPTGAKARIMTNTLARGLIAKSNPVLAAALGDQHFTNVAQDDLETLQAIEKWFYTTNPLAAASRTLATGRVAPSYGADLGIGIRQGIISAEGAMIWHQIMQDDHVSSEARKTLKAYDRELRLLGDPDNVASWTGYFLGQMGTSALDSWELAAGGAAVGAVGGAALLGIGAIPGALAGAATGGGYGVAAGMGYSSFKQIAGASYREMMQMGYDPDNAYWASVASGVLGGGLELVGLKLIGTPLAAGARAAWAQVIEQATHEALTAPTNTRALLKFGRDYVTGTGGEVVTEVSQEIIQVFANEFGRPGELQSKLATPEGQKEVKDRLVATFRQTLMGVSIIGGIGPSMGLYADIKRVEASRRRAEQMVKLNAMVQASRTVQRDPDAGAMFVNTVAANTPNTHIFVNGKVLQAELDKAGIGVGELDALVPGLSSQVRAAGIVDDVVIPIGDYMTKIAPTPLGASLLVHARFMAGDYSAAQLRDLPTQAEMSAEAERLAKETDEEGRPARESAGRLRDRLLAVAVENNRPQAEAEVLSTTLAGFYAVYAEAEGTTAEELFARHNPQWQYKPDAPTAPVVVVEQAGAVPNRLSGMPSREEMRETVRSDPDVLREEAESILGSWESNEGADGLAKPTIEALIGELERGEREVSDLDELAELRLRESRAALDRELDQVESALMAIPLPSGAGVSVERAESGSRYVKFERTDADGNKVGSGLTIRLADHPVTRLDRNQDDELLSVHAGEVDEFQTNPQAAVRAARQWAGVRETEDDLDQTMSTRVPTAKGHEMDALNNLLLAEWSAVLTSDRLVEANLARLKALGLPFQFDETRSPREQLESFVGLMTDNLDFLFSKVDPTIQERAKLWYVGANRIADFLSKRYGISMMQASAMLAVLSPQKNWFENVSMADRIGDILTAARDAKWTDKMEQFFVRMQDAPKASAARIERSLENLTRPSKPVKQTAESDADFAARKARFTKGHKRKMAQYETERAEWQDEIDRMDEAIAEAEESGDPVASLKADRAALAQAKPRRPRLEPQRREETEADFDARVAAYPEAYKAWADSKAKLNRLLAGAKSKVASLAALGRSKRMRDMRDGTLGTVLDAKDFELAAMFVRAYDEAYNSPQFAIITPEGGMAGPSMGANGPLTIRWGAYGSIQKAISVFEDGSAENIHYQIGAAHKVRNFYNNIFDPNSAKFVTIDTHAIAAALLMPLSASDALVAWGLGAGASDTKLGLHGGYPVVFEAYLRAAKQRGVLGREAQSITWEAIRGLFPAAQKKGLKPLVQRVWDEFSAGKLTLAEAREKVFEVSGGITMPEWTAQPTTIPVGSSYTGRSRTKMDERGEATARTAPAVANIHFEVAPSPRDVALAARWNALSAQVQAEISNHIALLMIPKITAEFGVVGLPVMQIGGWGDTTNVGFSLSVQSGPLVRQISRAVGLVLRQAETLTISDDHFQGATKAGAVCIQLAAGITPEQINDLYLRVLRPLGVTGHTTSNNRMIITGGVVAMERLGNKIANATRADPRIISTGFSKIWSATDAADAKSGRIQGIHRWGRIDNLQQEAQRELEAAISDAEGTVRQDHVRRGEVGHGGQPAEVGTLSPLLGAPTEQGIQGPDPRLVAVARGYAAAHGIPFARQAEYAAVDTDRGIRIAQAYADMKDDPTNPEVWAAYEEMARQTIAQYTALVAAGYRFYFFDPDNDPYASQPGGFGNPWNPSRDLRENQQMAVFPTDTGYGDGLSASDYDRTSNPLLEDTGVLWPFGDLNGPMRPVLVNDLFRAVHDAFGHGIEGAGFRARGEENAWQAHVRLFTGAAVGAMTSETRGQNSWLNFGPHGAKNRNAKVEDTRFAEQKIGLMPEWTWMEGRVGDADTLSQEAIPPRPPPPEFGVFDATNPPVASSTRGGGVVIAVMDYDGTIYYDRAANAHYDVTERFPHVMGSVIDGGFIKDGQYLPGQSDGGFSHWEIEGDDGDTTALVLRFAAEANARAHTLRQEASPVPKSPPAFFSALERAMSELGDKAMRPAGWMKEFQRLVDRGVVKKSELVWSGLQEWVNLSTRDPDGKLSARDIGVFLAEHGVKVQVVEKGDAAVVAALTREDLFGDESRRNLAVLEGGLELARDAMTRSGAGVDGALAIHRASENLRAAWIKWQDEDGDADALTQAFTAYRNAQRDLDLVLESIDDNETHDPPTIQGFWEKAARQLKQDRTDRISAARPRWEKWVDVGGKNYREFLITIPDHDARFRGPHWAELNVAVHIRVDDRIGDGGKRVLMVHEIQSDWGQMGRKKGFTTLEELRRFYAEEEAHNILIERRRTELYERGRKVIAARLAWKDSLGVATRETSQQLSDAEIAAALVLPRYNNLNLHSVDYALSAIRHNPDWVEVFNMGGAVPDDLAVLHRYRAAHLVAALVRKEWQEANPEPADTDTDLGWSVPPPPTHPDGPRRGPFVEETSDWVRLAIKQLLMVAVKEGYEAVAFMPGQRIAEVMRVSKVVDAISATSTRDGTYAVTIKDAHGNLENVETAMTEEALHTRFGKGLARRIIDGAKETGMVSLANLNTDIGSRGMVAFYDTLVPDVADSILRSLGGGKVERDRVVSEVVRYISITPALRESVEGGQPLFQSAPRPAPRGQINLKTLVTTLTSASEFSTWCHEAAHAHLEILTRLASDPKASERVKADLDAILRWFGIPDTTPEGRRQRWTGMSVKEQEQYHEQLAYNFEIYLSSGRAPSADLQSVFFKIATFMLRIYSNITEQLNAIYRDRFGKDLPGLSREVREVMDRWMTSEARIKKAQQVGDLVPLFQTREEAGMDEATWAAYQEVVNEATETSILDLAKASLRQMQWLSGARTRLLKRIQSEHEELRREVRERVEAEVSALPVYKALDYLLRGNIVGPDGTAQHVGNNTKLSRAAVAAVAPGVDLGRLAHPRYGIVDPKDSADAMHPDVVAEMFGFGSGAEMIATLVAAKRKREEIASRVDEEMTRRFGAMNSPEAIEARVQEALHNEARSRFVAVELRWLAKLNQPVMALMAAARQAAEEVIGRTKLANLRPSDYTAAESRAAREAGRSATTMRPAEAAGRAAYARDYNEQIAAGASEADAVSSASAARDAATQKAQERIDSFRKTYGDMDAQEVTIAAKRRQLLHNQLAKVATEAREDGKKGIRYLRRVLSPANRKRMGAEMGDQIEAILERFALTKREAGAAPAKRLAELIEELKAQGMVPDLGEVITDEGARRPISDLTVSEFQSLVEGIRQLERIGKNEQKGLTAKATEEFKSTTEAIVMSIAANANAKDLEQRTGTTKSDRNRAGITAFLVSHLKAAAIARILDGGKNGGPVWQYLIRKVNGAADLESKMRAETTLALTKTLEPLFAANQDTPDKMEFTLGGKKVTLTREQRVAVALNVGNLGNLSRLLKGEDWTVEDVATVLASLSKVQLEAVQAVWDHFEVYRPLISAKQRRVYGVEPEWVAANPLMVKSRDGQVAMLRGGYYPIKYDPRASGRVSDRDMARVAEREMQGAFVASTTYRGHLKSRAKDPNEGPLLLTLSGMYGGFNDTIHDLAYHEVLIDINRLLRSRPFDRAVRTHHKLGPEYMLELKRWVKDIAGGERNTDAPFLNFIRQGVSAAGLGFNAMSAVQQIIGFNQTIVRLGLNWTLHGISYSASDPSRAIKEATEQSEFMLRRGSTQFRELNEIRNLVQGESLAKRRIMLGTYFMMMKMQRVVDVATWHGARAKALSENFDEATVIALADQAVIDSQGSGMLKDLSAVERGGAAQKLFTVFYSYMNTVFNMAAVEVMTQKDKGKLTADLLLILSVPAVLSYALRAILTGQKEDEDEEEDDGGGAMSKLARRLVAEQLSYAMGTMVGLRELGNIADIVTGSDGARLGYQGPAGTRAFADLYNLATQSSQLEFDRAFRKAAINTLGTFTGLPSAQTNRTIDGIEALFEGETSNPLVPLTGIRR